MGGKMVRSWITTLGLAFALRSVSFACDCVSVPFQIRGLKNAKNGEIWMADIPLNASVGSAVWAIKRQLIRGTLLLSPAVVSVFLNGEGDRLTSLENMKGVNLFEIYPKYGTLVIKLSNP